jgi:hypothetical protein
MPERVKIMRENMPLGQTQNGKVGLYVTIAFLLAWALVRGAARSLYPADAMVIGGGGIIVFGLLRYFVGPKPTRHFVLYFVVLLSLGATYAFSDRIAIVSQRILHSH